MISLNNFRNLQRCRQPVSNYITPKIYLNFCITNASSSSSSSNNDKEKEKNLHKVDSSTTLNKHDEQNSSRGTKSAEALDKLNLLLTQMIQENTATSQSKPKLPKLDLAKPVNRRKQKVKETVIEADPAKQMLTAVKEVAKVVDGDLKQNEAELLQKLLNAVKRGSATEKPNNLSEIVKDMKVVKEVKPAETVSRAQQVRHILNLSTKDQSKQSIESRWKAIKRPDVSTEDQIVDERVSLFGEVGLGIFPSATEVNSWPAQNLNQTWKALDERELRLAAVHPSTNYFQQMIQWTEQKKIWTFPIDNEQDMDAEKSVYFTEHVFLEKHIESWCPPKGPIRHFMELVLVGLSKNHYLTVEDKKGHIEWFKNYFNEKNVLLKEVEAIPADFEFDKDQSHKLEA